MKKIIIFLLMVLFFILLWWLLRQDGSEASFSGVLRDASGQPVPQAVVSVGGDSTVTDEEGRFTIKGSWASRNRWVLEARRPGFAPISKVFGKGSEDVTLTAVETTSLSFDAGSIIVARDNRTNCIGSAASSVDWASHPTARYPQAFDASGNALTGTLPPTAQRALDFMSATASCNTGFQVTIPANGLVTASGQAARGQVDVELSTVDLYSPDGMPGDYTVTPTADGPVYMESFGAGTIEIRAGDDVLQLQKGTRAEILIPVDRTQIDIGSKVPESIPLLRYESKSGEWTKIGVAKLDEEQQAYVGEVEHFSEFNADVVKTNPACLAFNGSGLGGTFRLVTTAPTSSGGFKQVTHTVQPDTTQAIPDLHAIYNLPANEWVVLRAIQAGVPIGTWVVATGNSWGNTGAPGYDYAACGTVFNLSNTVASGVVNAGANRRFGPLPKHVSFLVNTSSTPEDVYPVGGANCNFPCLYLFSLFDTGSNLVVINSATATQHGMPLTASTLWDVDVRIDGYSTLSAGNNPGAPFALPGSSGGAQANSGVLRVAPRNLTIQEEEVHVDSTTGQPTGNFVLVDYNLVGAPVANKVVARIDYTTQITKGPWTFAPNHYTITAPDIEFFMPGASGIPTPTLTLFVEGFGSAAANPNGATDQRHFLQNVTFTKGTANYYDEQTLTNPKRFLFDTGTSFTVISQAMATALGANPASPNAAAGCSSNNTANFVSLDSITIVGMNSSNQLATYRVNNPEVCVDVGGTIISTHYPDPANPTAPARKVDAVIGSNLFDQAEILWDGPHRTVGILP